MSKKFKEEVQNSKKHKKMVNGDFTVDEQEEMLYDAHCLHEIRKFHPEYNKYIDWLGSKAKITPILQTDPKTGKTDRAYVGIVIDGTCFGIGLLEYTYTLLVPKNSLREEWRSWLSNLTVVKTGEVAYVGRHGDYRIIDPYEIMKVFIETHWEWYHDNFENGQDKK